MRVIHALAILKMPGICTLTDSFPFFMSFIHNVPKYLPFA